MTDFTVTQISKIADNFDNVRVPLSARQRENIEKIYPYYGAQSIIDYVDDYLFDGEYILVAEDGENLRSQNNNVCNLVTGKFWVNNHAHILKAKDGNNSKYLCYYLNLIDFKPFVTGSAQPKLTKDNLNSIPLKIHNKLEQESIAKVLSDLDAKIELNNKINTELEAMAKLLYDYWFVQFDFPFDFPQGKPSPNGKPYKSSGGKMVYNEQLKREIPEGWGVKMLKDYANISTGKLDSNAEVEHGEYYFYTCAATPTRTGTYAFDDDVILIAGNNANGNFHVNRFSGKFDAYQRTYVLTAKESIHLNYLYRVVAYQMKALKSQGKGSQTKFITLGMISDIPVFQPNSDLMSSFDKITNALYNKQIVIQRENQKLSELRDWLLPMLMNGQVTVRQAHGKPFGDVEQEMNMAAEGKVGYEKDKSFSNNPKKA